MKKKKKKKVSVHSRELPLVSILRFSQREDWSPLFDLLGLDSQRQPSAGAGGGWSDDETTRNLRCRVGTDPLACHSRL